MEELITCKICGKQSSRIYGAHLKSHDLTSKEYLTMFPGSPLYTEADNKQTTKNSGKHMKQEKYKKMLSEMFRGENNPNSKSKTTEEQRRQRSPFSKKFIKYNNENEALEFARKVNNNIPKEHKTTNIEYYLNKGYNQEESEIMLSERQGTFSLKKCIEKYGKINGKKIFKDRQNKWQKSLMENGKLKCGYSEISQDLFYKILEKYDFENRKEVYFTTKNQEYFIKDGKKFYQYDFTDKIKNKIIEYNGDSYHANPEIYESSDNPHPFRKYLTSQDIWNNDFQKLKVAKNMGFEVHIVWDSEYRKNPDKILQECLDFLNLK